MGQRRPGSPLKTTGAFLAGGVVGYLIAWALLILAALAIYGIR